MNKYNVGDVVKLRDDLECNIRYGEIGYNKKMDRMKNKPIKLLRINHIYDNSYEVEDETGENWFLSDEMIEGLWEECKETQDKIKLIDVLNMIAKGELKEGTKVKWDYDIYIYENGFFENSDGDELLFFINHNECLNDEVELIEPECKHECEEVVEERNVGADKMIEPSKIEELKYDVTDLDCLGIHNKTISLNIADKLNEVIRMVNAITSLLN